MTHGAQKTTPVSIGEDVWCWPVGDTMGVCYIGTVAGVEEDGSTLVQCPVAGLIRAHRVERMGSATATPNDEHSS